ncbi:hypothetical protein QIS74_10854 [Colletotrichum tabaci]|uniref:Uncharacterized protein n=2 Tax=Colletotrichum destructivum species complex TaxID=2707350 RepID=A0A5Q4BZP5_9PEZI|nr:hypothetical protein CSHISOI_02877 [Colletotrichum shisoi]
MAAFTLIFTPATADGDDEENDSGRSGYNKDGDDEDDKAQQNKGRSGYNKDGDDEEDK